LGTFLYSAYLVVAQDRRPQNMFRRMTYEIKVSMKNFSFTVLVNNNIHTSRIQTV